MTETEIREIVLRAVHKIAPEVDLPGISPDASLREEADIDSFDFLSLMIELSEQLGVDIPESDYARVTTVNDITRYVLAHRDRTPPGRGETRRG
jgi:acyl carrier protein